MFNSFGHLFRVTTWGESHGPALGCVVDGVPPGVPLLSYVSRDLEPYRGFHIVMRALPRLLRARPDLHVVMVGGDGVSYGARLAEGTWKERLLGEAQQRSTGMLAEAQDKRNAVLGGLEREQAALQQRIE